VYAARLVGLPIFDPQGDQIGKVRDLVVAIRSESSQPRVLGMVAEVSGRRRIFVPMTRVTNIDSGQVYTTGLLNMRRFEQRSTETLVMGELLDRKVTITTTGISGTVFDVAMEQARNRDWVVSRVAVQEPAKALRRRGQTHVVEWSEVTGLARPEPTQGATRLLHALNELRPADAASVIHDLPPERRSAVVAALTDERLADVLEELADEQGLGGALLEAAHVEQPGRVDLPAVDVGDPGHGHEDAAASEDLGHHPEHPRLAGLRAEGHHEVADLGHLVALGVEDRQPDETGCEDAGRGGAHVETR